MPAIERFEDIEAWKKDRALASEVYLATGRGAFARDFGLRDQLRRAAVSVPSNIAEGFEREGNNEFCQFLSIAKGSCGKVRAQHYVALDQRYITQDHFERLAAGALEVSRIISGLLKYLRQSQLRGPKYK